VPGPLGEELLGPVVRLGLYVLRQGEGDGAGGGRVGEDAHRGEGGGDQRLGPGDAVEVAGDGPQAVVDGDVARVGHFELLEDGVGGAGGEGVAGEEQDGQAVDGGQGGAGDEVGGARPDGGGDGVGGEAAALAGEAGGGVHHGLLTAALVEAEAAGPLGPFGGVLGEGLAEPGDVAVAEDGPDGRDQPLPLAVALAVLDGEEADQCLGGGEPHR
jgi:hypothetical protein